MRIAELGSLAELVHRGAAEFGAAPALKRAGQPEMAWTYEQLFKAARAGSAYLRAQGMAAGDRVLLALESGPQWAASYFAVLDAGMVVVPVLADLPAETVGAMGQFSEARAAVFSTRSEALTASLGGLLRIPVERLLAATPNGSNGFPRSRPDVAMLAFTSGTTQSPRAVELTHDNLLSDLDAVLHVRCGGPGDAMLSMLPAAHLFELMGGLLAPLACGARIVYAGSPLPNRIIAALREERITHTLTVPALVNCLCDELFGGADEARKSAAARNEHRPGDQAPAPRANLNTAGLEDMRKGLRAQVGESFHTIFVGGAAVDPARVDLLGAAGIRLDVGYGLTEASPIVTCGIAGECPRGSVGRPLPGVQVRIGEDDEILVRGANVMQGYHKDAPSTAAAFQDGWLRTGDRGRMDENGFLFVTGRLKEMIVTATGETVHPEEMEECYASPLFRELCVAALPGPDSNDVPVLFVVPALPDATSGTLEGAFARLRAAAPARLRVRRMIRLSAPLPRTATGKVRRAMLSQAFNDHAGAP